MLIYHQLTKRFNAGRLRAVMCSGQAVVMHRLAMASKDGDWIIRENQDDLDFILNILAEHGAIYRFGAPLDVRWMAGGWSAHFEFHDQGIRVRTDFFTRPPRLHADDLAHIWKSAEGDDLPYTGLRELVLMKMTMREKDYPIIGEMARRLESIDDQFLYSRSAGDLIDLASKHPISGELLEARPLLREIAEGEDALAVALDHERRQLMKADAARLARYQSASTSWSEAWPALAKEIAIMPLHQAHQHLTAAAETLLPPTP
jgi:hypothetical protein